MLGRRTGTDLAARTAELSRDDTATSAGRIGSGDFITPGGKEPPVTTHGVPGKKLTDFQKVIFSAVQQLQRDLIDIDFATERRVAGGSDHNECVSPHFSGFDLQVETHFHHLIIRQA